MPCFLSLPLSRYRYKTFLQIGAFLDADTWKLATFLWAPSQDLCLYHQTPSLDPCFEDFLAKFVLKTASLFFFMRAVGLMEKNVSPGSFQLFVFLLNAQRSCLPPFEGWLLGMWTIWPLRPFCAESLLHSVVSMNHNALEGIEKKHEIKYILKKFTGLVGHTPTTLRHWAVFVLVLLATSLPSGQRPRSRLEYVNYE